MSIDLLHILVSVEIKEPTSPVPTSLSWIMNCIASGSGCFHDLSHSSSRSAGSMTHDLRLAESEEEIAGDEDWQKLISHMIVE
jgi:hypothetical protein